MSPCWRALAAEVPGNARERNAQAVAACRGSPAEALPGALRPLRVRDRVRFSRKVMAEDELADSRTLGGASNLVDIGVQPSHPVRARR